MRRLGLVLLAVLAAGCDRGTKSETAETKHTEKSKEVVRYRLASDDPRIEEEAFVAATEGMAAEPADADLRAVLVDPALGPADGTGGLVDDVVAAQGRRRCLRSCAG